MTGLGEGEAGLLVVEMHGMAASSGLGPRNGFAILVHEGCGRVLPLRSVAPKEQAVLLVPVRRLDFLLQDTDRHIWSSGTRGRLSVTVSKQRR